MFVDSFLQFLILMILVLQFLSIWCSISLHFFPSQDSSCIVVDYDNLESNETIPFEYVKVEGKGKKYFLIVMLPIIVVLSLLSLLWGANFRLYLNKPSDELQDDEEGQTEATILGDSGVDQESVKVVEMEEENRNSEGVKENSM